MEYLIISDFFTTKFGGIDAYIFSMKVKDLLPIYYVAVRGRDDIEGAVQRVLNKRRIGAIKSFILEGNMFFNSFILNWTDKNYPLAFENENLQIARVPAAAQVIDGQHRLEGLKQAVEEKSEIGEQSVTVVLVQNLSTTDAAKIFLNINAEQKPVSYMTFSGRLRARTIILCVRQILQKGSMMSLIPHIINVLKCLGPHKGLEKLTNLRW